MDSVLVRFKDKSYYVDYDDLLNKANDKLFAYEDEALEINAKLNGKTLMFNKSEMEDKLKKGINMPTRMPSNLATETIRENKMTNEQKLRKHIREMIIEVLKEGGDPYGRPDEDKYLFKTGDDYLAGIQGESVEDEEKAGKEEYKRFFSKALSKFGYSSVDSMPDEKRKEFYAYVDSNWTSTDGNIYQKVESVDGEPSAEELAAKETAAKEKAEKTAYQRFFSQTLAKFGYSGAASIPDEKKREFYDFIDQNWTSKQEVPKKKVAEDLSGMPELTKYEYEGKTYDVYTFPDDDSANEFMEKNDEWGVLDVTLNFKTNDREVILAKTDDMGWTDPAGGKHDWDEEDPAKMYETVDEKDLHEGAWYECKVPTQAQDGRQIKPGMWFMLQNFEENKWVQIETDKYNDEDKNMFMVNHSDFLKNFQIHIAHSDLQETSATGGVAGYETPMAFTGKKGISKKQKNIANQLGYELVDKSYAVKEEESQRLDESMDTLYFKDESLTAEQKLGLAMRHVRNNLQEVEKIVRRTIRMKNEENIDSTKVGKRTYNALKRINEKVIRLMVAMNDLK